MTTEPIRLNREQRALGKILILDLYEDLDALRGYARGQARPQGLRPIPEWVADLPKVVDSDNPQTRLLRWANVFDDELNIVRAARNTVAHALPIDDADLVSAVRIAARLLMYARVSGYPDDYERDIAFQDKRIADALNFPRIGGNISASLGTDPP